MEQLKLKIQVALLLFIPYCFFSINNSFSSALVIKNTVESKLTLRSHLYLYGQVDELLATQIADEINLVWNENNHKVEIDQKLYQLIVRVTTSVVSVNQAIAFARLNPLALNNFIRINSFPNDSIPVPFILGNTNSGIWISSFNLGKSTTAAHEYGHSLGLNHPLDEGLHMGTPRLMITDYYPVEAKYWLNPNAFSGDELARLDLNNRQLTKADVRELGLEKLNFDQQETSTIGKYDFIFIYDQSGRPVF
jgi:hypothetical protein